MGKYFGTDGIRGEAYVDLTESLAYRVGRAFGIYLHETNHSSDLRVCIGRDTRISGDAIERSLISGFVSSFVSVRTFGVVPTPAVSRLTPRLTFNAGVVISASHNPVKDNGIKLFNHDGFKLSDQAEHRIEELMDLQETEQDQILSSIAQKNPPPPPSTFSANNEAVETYVKQIVDLYPKQMLKGYHILVDLAHGATCYTTPTVLRALGAEVHAINDTMDGNKINVKCGSTYIENLRNYALERGISYDIAFAHDGDGDRVLALDKEGKLMDGDIMLSLCALDRKSTNQLPGSGVVGTLMTNEGVVDFLREHGISLFRSDVGDKYVLRDMQRLGYQIGGEQSGHILFTDLVESGDGLVTLLEFLKTLVHSQFTVLDKRSDIHFYHQKLTNVKCSSQHDVIESKPFQFALQQIVDNNPDVRINVRASGTEPLIRILTESRSQALVDNIASKIADLVTVNQPPR